MPTTSATSVDIGNSIKISTNRYSTSMFHKLYYRFSSSESWKIIGNSNDYIGASYTWAVPISLIPTSKSKTCYIKCVTYLRSGTSPNYSYSTVGENTSCSFTIKAPKPSVDSVISLSVGVDNSGIQNLPEGLSGKLISGLSKANCSFTVAGGSKVGDIQSSSSRKINGASITSVKLNGVNMQDSSKRGANETGYVFNGATYNKYTLVVQDSRGYEYTKTVDKSTNFVAYSPLKLYFQLYRPEPTGDEIKMKWSGTYAESVGGAANNLSLSYKCRKKNSVVQWEDMTATVISPEYLFSQPISMVNMDNDEGEESGSFNYKKSYEFKFYASDILMNYEKDVEISQGIPMFHYGKNSEGELDFIFEVPVTFAAGIVGDFVTERGVTNGWEWEKTYCGKSEARKRIQYSVDVNTASGALYRSGIISFSEHPYPTGLFVDIPNVQITITPTDGYITWYGAWESPTNIQPPAIRLLKVLSSTGNTGYINITATGKWQ